MKRFVAKLQTCQESLWVKITEPVQVELVNPVAEITYQNNVKIYADDIILSDSDEVVLMMEKMKNGLYKFREVNHKEHRRQMYEQWGNRIISKINMWRILKSLNP